MTFAANPRGRVREYIWKYLFSSAFRFSPDAQAKFFTYFILRVTEQQPCWYIAFLFGSQLTLYNTPHVRTMVEW